MGGLDPLSNRIPILRSTTIGIDEFGSDTMWRVSSEYYSENDIDCIIPVEEHGLKISVCKETGEFKLYE